MRSSFLSVLALLAVAANPAFGQDETPAPSPLTATRSVPRADPIQAEAEGEGPAKRPAALVPLYASLATLNALDVHYTLDGLSRGTVREVNPLVHPFVQSRAAFVALKIGTTATAILVAEGIRKKHPKRAVVLMIATNAAMAAIVANNYRAHRR